MDRTSESISHRLMDGYGAGSAVMRRRVGWIGVSVWIGAISGLAFSVSIAFHFDNVFTVSLFLHRGRRRVSVLGCFGCLRLGLGVYQVRGKKKKAVGPVAWLRLSRRLEPVSIKCSVCFPGTNSNRKGETESKRGLDWVPG